MFVPGHLLEVPTLLGFLVYVLIHQSLQRLHCLFWLTLLKVNFRSMLRSKQLQRPRIPRRRAHLGHAFTIEFLPALLPADTLLNQASERLSCIAVLFDFLLRKVRDFETDFDLGLGLRGKVTSRLLRSREVTFPRKPRPKSKSVSKSRTLRRRKSKRTAMQLRRSLA